MGEKVKFIRPNRLHEANVQAEVYRQLRNNDIKCCLEYRIHCPKYNCIVRADIVIIRDGLITAIIECKSRKSDKKPNYSGRQYKKYKSIGIPVIYCMDFKQAINILDEIQDFI